MELLLRALGNTNDLTAERKRKRKTRRPASKSFLTSEQRDVAACGRRFMMVTLGLPGKLLTNNNYIVDAKVPLKNHQRVITAIASCSADIRDV